MNTDITLEDPAMIFQSKKMFSSEMEPLYWRIEDCLSNGDVNTAQGLFSILLYVAKYNKKLMLEGLRPAYLDRLKEISFELYGDHVPSKRMPVTIKKFVSPVKIPFQNESELQHYLLDHPDVLSDALGDDIQIRGSEVKVDHEYRCDIVAEGKMFYPIELKIGQTNHASVSQCNKYCFYFYRKLRYGHYKQIQGVIIGNGFDDWSINELRREGIWCFRVVANKNDIGLEKI